jgi:predicted permease
MAFHLQMKQGDGMDRRTARVRFGNPDRLREEIRAVGSLPWLDATFQDVRYALRQFRRTPMLFAAIVLSLTVGIGANTAIFTLVDAALLKPLPVADPDSLVLITWTSDEWPEGLANGHTGSFDRSPSGEIRATSVAPGLHRRLARAQSVFTSISGFSDSAMASVVLDRRPPEQAALQHVSANFFAGLGVSLTRGRAFLPDDDVVGAAPVVVISHRFWRSALRGREDVAGLSLRVNGVGALVVGVAPPGFFGIETGEWVDLYAPLAARVAFAPPAADGAPGAELDDDWWVRQIARLAPGANPGAATGHLSALFRRLVVPESAVIEPARVPDLTWSPARRGFDPVGQDQSRALWILFLLVGVVLLIVCANVANLLLARAIARQRESAVRLALGAGRGRLVRQHLVEGAVLAACGGALGTGVGYLLANGLDALYRQQTSAGAFDLRPDERVLAFTAGLSMLSALIFGLVPAIRGSRAPLIDPLKSAGRAMACGQLRLPRVLVAVQVALCLVVLVAAGLLGRSLHNLKTTETGLDLHHIVYVSVNPWRAGIQGERVGAYVDEFRRQLVRLPGVSSVAMVGHRPLSGSVSSTFANLPGRPFVQDRSSAVFMNLLSDGAVETLGLALLAGRGFNASDMRADRNAVLVDERFAGTFFPGRQALGQRFGLNERSTSQYEIIGVVRNSRYHGLRSELAPTVYRPYRPADLVGRDIHVAIRTSASAAQLGNAVRRTAAGVHSDVPVTEIVTQSSLIDRILRTERLLGTMSSAFSGVALLLAAVGLGGLLGYVVARRTSEFGVRMALGAAPSDISRIVLRDAFRLFAIGVAVGIPASLGVASLFQSALFGVEAMDPATSALSLAMLAAVIALAAWLPARRAATIQPIVALREE